MPQLTCQCLNVRVHATGWSSVTPELTNEELSDAFFAAGVTAVTLDLAGVTHQVASLAKTRDVGRWRVHACVACRTDALAVAPDLVLVSRKLLADAKVIASKMKSDEYSPLYKIVVPAARPTHPLEMGGVQRHVRRSEALEIAIGTLQTQLTKYLRTEQEDCEERIRNYVKQQREALAALQKRVWKDKEIVTSWLVQCEETKVENSISEAMIDECSLTPPTTPTNDDNNNVSPGRETRDRLTSEERDEVVNRVTLPPVLRQRPQSFGRPLIGKMAIRKKVTINPPRIAKSLDMDGIFQIEGLEDELVPPFYHSEDDGTDGDDLSDKSSDDVFAPIKKDPYADHPASLPVNVPIHNYRNIQLNNSRRPHDDIDEDEKISLPDDPAQVAASFKALAKSVHLNDTTEMFGDLPRPRLNTMN